MQDYSTVWGIDDPGPNDKALWREFAPIFWCSQVASTMWFCLVAALGVNRINRPLRIEFLGNIETHAYEYSDKNVAALELL